MRCPKSGLPIQIIVFDELELIIFVSQGLTLSTASLVDTKNVSKTGNLEKFMVACQKKEISDACICKGSVLSS